MYSGSSVVVNELSVFPVILHCTEFPSESVRLSPFESFTSTEKSSAMPSSQNVSFNDRITLFPSIEVTVTLNVTVPVSAL